MTILFDLTKKYTAEEWRIIRTKLDRLRPNAWDHARDLHSYICGLAPMLVAGPLTEINVTQRACYYEPFADMSAAAVVEILRAYHEHIKSEHYSTYWHNGDLIGVFG